MIKIKYKEIIINGLPYKVFENGTIYGKQGKELKQRYNQDGYKEITVGNMQNRVRERVHRIVGMCFVENDFPNQKTEINHKDFNRANNHYTNLEWCTHQENIAYSYENGRHDGARAGIKNERAKLTQEKADMIRKLYFQDNQTISEIARIFDVGWTTVSHILKNETWAAI